MMTLSIGNILLFLSILWLTNGTLNLLYVLKKHVPFVKTIDRPIDLGKLFFDKKRILGNSTTILGLVVALLFSLLFSLINLYSPTVAFLTPLLVFLGHAIGSFIKRRLNKNDVFVPFVDHGDYVIMSGVVLFSLGQISGTLALVCLLITYIAHPFIVHVAYKWGLRERYY